MKKSFVSLNFAEFSIHTLYRFPRRIAMNYVQMEDKEVRPAALTQVVVACVPLVGAGVGSLGVEAGSSSLGAGVVSISSPPLSIWVSSPSPNTVTLGDEWLLPDSGRLRWISQHHEEPYWRSSLLRELMVHLKWLCHHLCSVNCDVNLYGMKMADRYELRTFMNQMHSVNWTNNFYVFSRQKHFFRVF